MDGHVVCAEWVSSGKAPSCISNKETVRFDPPSCFIAALVYLWKMKSRLAYRLHDYYNEGGWARSSWIICEWSGARKDKFWDRFSLMTRVWILTFVASC
ncbi:hypothetical protein U1Q18_027734 [Sarracenia purpurea var. burkii]